MNIYSNPNDYLDNLLEDLRNFFKLGEHLSNKYEVVGVPSNLILPETKKKALKLAIDKPDLLEFIGRKYGFTHDDVKLLDDSFFDMIFSQRLFKTLRVLRTVYDYSKEDWHPRHYQILFQPLSQASPRYLQDLISFLEELQSGYQIDTSTLNPYLPDLIRLSRPIDYKTLEDRFGLKSWSRVPDFETLLSKTSLTDESDSESESNLSEGFAEDIATLISHNKHVNFQSAENQRLANEISQQISQTRDRDLKEELVKLYYQTVPTYYPLLPLYQTTRSKELSQVDSQKGVPGKTGLETLFSEVQIEPEDNVETIDNIINEFKLGIRPEPHSKIEAIYRIHNPKLSKQFQNRDYPTDNLKWLWHGTETPNVLSILVNGFRVNNNLPKGVRKTGQKFGPGIYFGSKSLRSLSFTGHGLRRNCRERSHNQSYKYDETYHGWILLCHVDLGTVHYPTKIVNPSDDPWLNYNSIHVIPGKVAGLLGDEEEIIVPDPDRILPYYLIKVKCI